MRWLFSAVYSEIRGLHQSAYILGAFSFGSQILALVRDRLFAHYFGASSDLDVYYAAFKVPDLLFVLFASVLSVYVLIPFVSEKTENGNVRGAQHMLSNVFSAFLIGYVVAAVGIGIFAGSLTSFLFPGFDTSQQVLLVTLLRILLLQPFLLGISSLFGVITQLGQRFVLYALSPLLYNAGIIFGVVVLYPTWGMLGVVWGVLLGALLHLLIQLPLVQQSDLRPRLLLRINTRELGRILANSLPRALTLSLNQIVLLAYVGIASAMAKGSVSIFQFAFNLQSVPLAIIGVSYSVAAFPILAQLYSKGHHMEYVERVETTLRHLVFWIIPITGFTIVLRSQIVRVILGSGAFNWDATRLTAAALALFSLSLAAQSVNLLIVRAFYAGGNTKIPFAVTVLSTVGTLCISLGLYSAFISFPSFAFTVEQFLRVTGIQGAEIIMLPLGYSIGQILHTFVLLFIFMRKYKVPYRQLTHTCARSLVAMCVGGVISYGVLNLVVSGINTEKFMGILLHGAVAGAAGLSGVIWLLYILKSPELQELWGALRKRPLFARIFGPEKVDTLAL